MALSYTRSILKAISTFVQASQPRCPFDLWRRLIDHGISRAKPTRRGYRGNVKLFTNTKIFKLSSLEDLETTSAFSTSHFKRNPV